MDKTEFENELKKLSTTPQEHETIRRTIEWIKTVPGLIEDYEFSLTLIKSALKYGLPKIQDDYNTLAALALTPSQLKRQFTRYLLSLGSVNMGEEKEVYILYKSMPVYNKKLDKNIVNIALFLDGQIYFPTIYLPVNGAKTAPNEIDAIESNHAYKLNALIDSTKNLRFSRHLNLRPSTLSPPSEDELELALAKQFPKLDPRLNSSELLSRPTQYYSKGFIGEILQESATKVMYQFFPEDDSEDASDMLPETQFIASINKDIELSTHDLVMIAGTLTQARQSENSVLIFANFAWRVKSAHAKNSPIQPQPHEDFRIGEDNYY